jgi:hypothetical protein
MRRDLVVVTCTLAALLAGPAHATPITLHDPRTAAFVGQAQQGPLDTPVLVTGYPEFTGVFGASSAGLANPYLAASVAAYFANGGFYLYVVRTAGADDASLIGVDGGPGARSGLQALRDQDDVGMVAVPGSVSHPVQNAMIALCESMGDRIAILDPVSATDVNAVTAQRASLVSANGYAALYFPWVQAAPLGVSQTLPPSAFVAGVMARTSPAVSPTGSLSTVSGFSLAINTTLDGTLNSAGICSLRQFAGPTFQVWGARTIASNVEYQYIAVRRMAACIEASVRRGTTWCLTQPNDATLWAQLTSDITSFMQNLWVGGWFKGTTANQAYLVQCGPSTMTAQDLEGGKTNMLVGFAPLRAAEYVLMTITQQRPSATGVAPDSPRFSFAAPRPNPARGATILAFTLPRDGAVTLRIFDAAGRLVRTLAQGGQWSAGAHEMAWDGRDEGGRIASPGAYLARIESAGGARSQRVLRIH